ncbi:DUF4974 domain-containing protein [Pseudoflavitalea sp. G-6-1-2]|uniref:FecR family protein n=1 Tax=Pseudoflavitalea sp. G-6-1-2 TaxID=2728841 RepID=UPI00146EB7F3|nr:FecR domain-containing protein [Pseudoflavitalea sp. G-6-1-2]NML21393.1 DUF4974 domain-containing protein [Pseudoflavitalea sp. G-6-1-2]
MKEAEIALLKKHLQGNCTPEELEQVHLLLQRNGSQFVLNNLMDELYAKQWEQAEQPGTQLPVDTEQMKHQLHQQAIESLPAIEDQPQQRKPVWLFRNWRNAAVCSGLIFLGGLTWWQLRSDTSATEETMYAGQVNNSTIPQSYILPDNSVVHLGAGASIRYASDFGKTNRTLTLQGQAFFDVRADKNLPFTVSTGQVETIVLGTSFKVDAFAGEPVVVAVASGKVSVSKSDSQQRPAILNPGRKITWDVRTGKSAEEAVETAALEQWKSGDLIFDEQPLGIVFRELETRYSCTIQLSDATLGNYRISGMFPANETLQQIMKVLSVSGKFSYNSANKKDYRVTPKAGR